MRYGVTARRKRNQGRLARLQDLRRDRREHRGPQGLVQMAAGEGQLSGRMVIEAEAGAFARWGVHVGDVIEVRDEQ